MKLIRLILKLTVLIFLALVRSGEIEKNLFLSFLKTKYHNTASYYIDRVADVAIFLLFLDFFQFTLIALYRRRKRINRDDNFIIGVGHIYSILLVAGVIIGALSVFRIDVKSLLTSLSIVFAGLALLTKDYISNMITGMIITFSNEINIGDNISIGVHKGKVLDITLQKIHILNDDDDIIFVPNNLFNMVEVVNYTKRHIKRTSIEFEMDISHLNNVEEIERMLIETLSPYHDHIQSESYYLRVAEVKKDFVAMKFQYILKKPNKELERTIRRKTVRRIVQFISTRDKIVEQRPQLPEDSDLL